MSGQSQLDTDGAHPVQGTICQDHLYAIVLEPFLCLLCRWMAGLVLYDTAMRVVLSVHTGNMFLAAWDLGYLVQVETCQSIYLLGSSAWVNWVKSSVLIVSNGWEVGSLPPMLQGIYWTAASLLYLGVHLSPRQPSLLENCYQLKVIVSEWPQAWADPLLCLSLHGKV